MTTVQLTNDIYHNINIISKNEGLLNRVAKYVRRLAKQVTDDPTLMTKEEFFARVDEAAKGKSTRMLPNENLTEFLRRQGYDL